jgi:competence protein ComEA
LNDAMPQWRTFSSEPPPLHGAAGAPSAEPPARPSRQRIDALTAGLIGLGGAALAGAAVVAIGLFGALAPNTGILADTGEPLDAAGLAVSAPQDAVDAAFVIGEDLVVDVAGAVAHPGLHRLAIGARVGDAIEAAGGFAPRVDLAEVGRSLNLAEPLTDGSKVHVPELGFDRLEAAPADDARIDLNQADQASLESLPGIGPVTATKIIDARSSSRFGTVRELRDRGLVGDSVFEQIKDKVRVGS